jgi:glycosidase
MHTGKKIIYQVFTRLFGNTNTTNKPWGTIAENGVGKFSDFTAKALNEIKELGVTHIWYTGVPHHALINDYTAIGISNDHPDVVKGRAGSPYAVKDYYNVNPDLADNPANRLEEFKSLLERSHKSGLKVIIDIVPNHVARKYEGKTNPPEVSDFGSNDDKWLTYSVNNNFYYNPGESFSRPDWLHDYKPLGEEYNPSFNEKFMEIPAKWTGNGSRLSKPHFYDWYETVKLNYGISPDGNKDFDCLPEGFDKKDYKEHFAFWKNKTVPDTWKKFRDIALYWIEIGVDGFRYDMAELVPVEFWSFMNSSVKNSNCEAFLLAEVYDPSQYRTYLHLGKMDYLYDKVGIYDSLKRIIQGNGSTDEISAIQYGLGDIEHQMVHFLENHDEQRIASPEFAGDAMRAKPAMVVSACLSTSPTMIYFGQEVGEPGAENAGFGSHSRTSIFDYIGVPHHQRWVNNKKFDGGQLGQKEKDLRDFYKRLLSLTIKSSALMGRYQEIHGHNRAYTPYYNHHVFSFVRYSGTEKLLIVCNFHPYDTFGFELGIPGDIIKDWGFADGNYNVTDQLYKNTTAILKVYYGYGKVRVDIGPLDSYILKIES